MMIALRGIEAFDEVQRLIVIGAHADDAETMCGGTLALLARRGVTIFLANCTLGDLGTQDPAVARPALAATRMEETAAAARILRIAETYNLGHHDGELLPSLELRAQLAHLYRITGADTLFTFDPFWSGQIHPDHRAAGRQPSTPSFPPRCPSTARNSWPNAAQILAVLSASSSSPHNASQTSMLTSHRYMT
jgi:LmbE family N-acetylglucosaminyl deacetylase